MKSGNSFYSCQENNFLYKKKEEIFRALHSWCLETRGHHFLGDFCLNIHEFCSFLRLVQGCKVIGGGNAGGRETRSEFLLQFEHLWSRERGGILILMIFA